MRRSHGAIALLAATSILCSCDVDLFGSDTKKIGRNYRLTRVDWPGEFEFSSPSRTDGEAVSEIGWQKPLIILRQSKTQDWELIDTTTGKRTPISEWQRRSDPRYSSIEIHTAAEAWHLPRKKRRW